MRPTTGGLKLVAGAAGTTLPTLAYRRFKKTPVVGGLEPPVTASSVVVYYLRGVVLKRIT